MFCQDVNLTKITPKTAMSIVQHDETYVLRTTFPEMSSKVIHKVIHNSESYPQFYQVIHIVYLLTLWINGTLLTIQLQFNKLSDNSLYQTKVFRQFDTSQMWSRTSVRPKSAICTTPPPKFYALWQEKPPSRHIDENKGGFHMKFVNTFHNKYDIIVS